LIEVGLVKGKISLKDFINEVKQELRASVNDVDPFFIMGDVELEVTFALEVEGGASAKLVVVDLNGAAKGSQTHTVKLTLTPFVAKTPLAPPSGGKSPATGAKNSTSRAVPTNPTLSASLQRPTAEKPPGIKRPTAKAGDVKVALGGKQKTAVLGVKEVKPKKPTKRAAK